MMRKGADERYSYDKEKIKDKIYGAWLGRICGCMLGKSVEGVRTDDLIPFLKETIRLPSSTLKINSPIEEYSFVKE